MVLHFGGEDEEEEEDIETIHKYSVSAQTWTALSCQLPMALESVCCVVTSDEKYVLLLGGQTYDGWNIFEHDGILVYDVEKEKIRKSAIEVPSEVADDFTTTNIAAIALEEDAYVLVSGYLRGFEEIPLDIVHLIGDFIHMEYVYLISKKSYQKNCWKIAVDDILNN